MGLKTGMGATVLMPLLVLAALQYACTRQPPAAPAGTELVNVGEALFNDIRLGADGNTSCATCHISDRAFTDGRPVSSGAFGRNGTRNSPSLVGLKEEGPQFWDGRESALAQAVMQPLGNPQEMGHDSVAAAMEHIASIPEYRAYFGGEVTHVDVAAALSSYLVNLDKGTSRYERARNAADYRLLGEEAQRGMDLFQGRAQCSSCHLEGDLTDESFHHASVGFDRIAGNIRALQARLDQTAQTGQPLGKLILSDPEIAELGRFAVTSDPKDLGAFRTPSLRNVARTAPYMHDGSIRTLEAAIEHELYYRSLTSGRPINLTVEERRDLAAFLTTLSTE